MSIPTKMFLSYSHQNRRDKDILIEKLAVMIQNREITVWHDEYNYTRRVRIAR